MHKLIPLVFISFTASAESKVDKVVVFADRAEVTRTQTVACTAGKASATFERLPDAVDQRTLRGITDKSAEVVGVSSERERLTAKLDARVQKIDDEIEKITLALRALGRARADQQERASSLAGYQNNFVTLAREEARGAAPDLGKWSSLLEWMRAEQKKARDDELARQQEERVHTRKLNRLRQRRAQFAAPTAATISALKATVNVKCNAPRASVQLAYVVPGATWKPEYDLRFKSKSQVGPGDLELVVSGVIEQSSGEDWDNARIWLSTAKPKLGGEAPIPAPIWVRGGPDESDKTLVSAQEVRKQNLQGAGNAGGQKPLELEDGGKAFILKLKERVSVKSDGRPYWFPVDTQRTTGKGGLVAIPKLSPYVFQVVNLKNPAPYPLLAGRMNVFRKGAFMGEVKTKYRAPGEAFEISLGTFEEVRVDRKDLFEKKRKGGFLSGAQTIEHGYRTLLKSRSKAPVLVEIREQIPVSKNDEIKVTLVKGTSAKYKKDALRGHIKWLVRLEPGQVEKRDLKFTIKLPKDWKVR